MNPTLEEISEKARPVFEKYGVKRARIFGSFARGDARPDSDVDFLIACPDKTSLWDFIGLHQDLSESLNREVDVVSESNVIPYFRDSIYRDLQPLYEG